MSKERLTATQRLEKKVEKAKDPLTRVIRAKSSELKMIAGRLEIADTIIFTFRSESGLKYPKAIADQAIADFLSICEQIDSFDAKYFNYIRKDEKSEYLPLKLFVDDKSESEQHTDAKPAKPAKGDSNAG